MADPNQKSRKLCHVTRLEHTVITNIIRIRTQLGISQRALAHDIDRTPSAVCAIESQQRFITLHEIVLVAKALGVQNRALFEEPTVDA